MKKFYMMVHRKCMRDEIVAFYNKVDRDSWVALEAHPSGRYEDVTMVGAIHYPEVMRIRHLSDKHFFRPMGFSSFSSMAIEVYPYLR